MARFGVTVSQRSYYIQAGDDVTLQCSISSTDGLDRVYWKKRERTVYGSDRGPNDKYSGSSITDPSLTIHNTTLPDSEYYYCHGRKGNKDKSKHIYLQVTEVTVRKTSYTMPIGTSVTLECTILPRIGLTDVYWTKGGQQVYSYSRMPNPKYSGSWWFKPSLTIRNTVVGDTGNYTCKGQISQGDVSSSPLILTSSLIRLKVYKPFTVSILPDSSNIIIEEGHHPQTRTCTSDDCSDDCEMEWTLPNGVKKRSNIFTKPITKDEAGIYTCTVRSRNQTQSQSFYVTVNYGPKSISLSSPNSMTVQEGHRIHPVTCQAECSPACSFVWTGPNTGKYGQSGAYLNLGYSNKRDRGIYSCMAYNDFGNISSSLWIDVNYGPKTISLSPPGDVSVPEGQQISVGCQADCSPSCDINWTGPSTGLPRTRGPNLSISKPDKSDNGVYVCTASNEYGNKSTSLRIDVNYGGSDIRLVPEDTHYSYKEGTAIPDIRCVADCNPTCEMSWYHDRTEHITTGSNLSLRRIGKVKGRELHV
ncbi:hemicentin-2-like [Pecten maximus]|uniref:hemicentin-2-like n=1 Tax=Pecten maximus TaxID=6579 RepID=UPI0014585FCC|nr:hemicentin-2-like [Pecten maximus]